MVNSLLSEENEFYCVELAYEKQSVKVQRCSQR